MRIKATKKAFSLIELLVVITIIGILATGATTVYTSQIQKARDSTRMTDVKALQSSIEQFYQDKSVYPMSKADWTSTGSTSVTIYMPNLAEDPKHDQTCIGSRCAYGYVVNADDNGITQGSYELSTAFENLGNVDNLAATDTGLDDNRLEVGLDNDTNDTEFAQSTDLSTDEVTDGGEGTLIYIVKGNVLK